MRQERAIIHESLSPYRSSGVLTLLLYLCSSVAAPMAHMLEHEHIEHSHAWNTHGEGENHAPHHHHRNLRELRRLISRGEVKASDFLDAKSGRVDLYSLSMALGLAAPEDAQHEGCQNTPTHDPFTHSDHVEEHFALAYLKAKTTQVLPIALASSLPAPQALASLSLPPRPAYLDLSYPQGPPGNTI